MDKRTQLRELNERIERLEKVIRRRINTHPNALAVALLREFKNKRRFLEGADK
jgi:hypothetical protein